MSLKTLMFGWEYPPKHCGGLGVACQGIVRGLLHHGAEVTLVLPHDESVEPGATIVSAQDLADGVQVLAVPSAIHPYDSVESYADRMVSRSGSIELYGAGLGEAVERYTAVASELTKNISTDIVHTHDWMTLEAGLRAARRHRKPLVAHVHATELDRTEFKPNDWILRREVSGLMKADHVIAVSGYTKALLVREYGIDEEKISILHNGTSESPTQTYAIQDVDNHPLVLFLGRLTVQKGPMYFLKAAKTVLKYRPDVRFVVAGDGYLLPQLINQSIDCGLQDAMIFAGKVTSDEAKALYQQASCFVMPSVSEPFGLVALEAITHGAPVILSRQSGASEVVKNALTVDFWDTDRMADCILTVLREPSLTTAMRRATPRILSGLTWHGQGRRLINIYQDVRRDF